uniref:Uncharacterized protein n=1 Tax=Amphimedon queenslandica TaxID=400682 RepID=A0A1X7TWZ1_AMPQE
IIGEQTTQALDSLHDDMAHFYNGISGDKLVVSNPEIGSKITSRELPLIEYGFSTVEEFLACIYQRLV